MDTQDAPYAADTTDTHREPGFQMVRNRPLARLIQRIAGIQKRVLYKPLSSRHELASRLSRSPARRESRHVRPFGSPDVPLFSFPTVHRKKVVAAFDGGRITSDGGVMLLGAVERQLGIADTLARLISDPRNPALVTHGVDDI